MSCHAKSVSIDLDLSFLNLKHGFPKVVMVTVIGDDIMIYNHKYGVCRFSLSILQDYSCNIWKVGPLVICISLHPFWVTFSDRFWYFFVTKCLQWNLSSQCPVKSAAFSRCNGRHTFSGSHSAISHLRYCGEGAPASVGLQWYGLELSV